MFENVQFFSHLHLKYAKSAIMTQKFFSWKISIWVSKKCKILCWFQIRWCRLSEMPLTKVKSKKPRKMHKNEKTQNSHSFLAPAFFRGICLSRHQRIWNQHKILRFLIPILIFFKKNFFWVILALFVYFKCKCEKNCPFSNILQKVKSYFLPISIILRVIPIKFETLKPPSLHIYPAVNRGHNISIQQLTDGITYLFNS